MGEMQAKAASGFHAFILDATNPSVIVLQHWQSPDGQVWSRQMDVSTYSPPHGGRLSTITVGS